MPRTRWRALARSGLLLVLGLGAASALTEHVLELRDVAKLTATETFYSVSGRRVRYRLTGPGLTGPGLTGPGLTGARGPGPTVILLNGGHASLEQWSEVQNALSAIAPVLAYDRVGTGFNDAVDAHDVIAQADELDRLLRSTEIERPFVLVGYSAGSLLAIVFAARHLDVVKGLVFVDPILSAAPGTKSWQRTLWRTNVSMPVEAFFGYTRLRHVVHLIRHPDLRRTATPVSERANALLENTHHWLNSARESITIDKSAGRADGVMATHPFAGLPLAVLTTADPTRSESQRDVFDRHRQLAASSDEGLFRTVHADHGELLHDPLGGEAIVDVVRAVVGEVRARADAGTSGGSP